MAFPVHIAGTGQFKQLLSSTTVVVTDFYADWCGPCKTIAPEFERMSKQFSAPKVVAFAKVNVDQQQGIAQTYGVRAWVLPPSAPVPFFFPMLEAKIK